jgi:hypothetical protein
MRWAACSPYLAEHALTPRICIGGSEALRFLQVAGVDLSAGNRNAPTVDATVGAFCLRFNLD